MYDKYTVMSQYDFKEALSIVEVLALWDIHSHFDTFSNIVWVDFTISTQKKLFHTEIFTNEEWKYLLIIFILMKQFFLDYPDLSIKENINNSKMLFIKHLDIELLSLDTMNRFMSEIRAYENYKWIWDFY